MRCDQVAKVLADVAIGEELRGEGAAHVRGCLRCQAEVALYRKLFRVLHTLRGELLLPPSDLLPEIFAALDHPDAFDPRRLLPRARRVAYVGGLAAATAAGAAGAIVIASLSRRSRLAS